MRTIWIIARRELGVFFDSLMAYILIILFLTITGILTWLYGNDIFISGQANLSVFFFWAYWTLFLFIPAITMRLIAEEKRSGTIELLLTRPVTDWQFVTGKFISAIVLVAIALALTLPYYFTVWKLGPVDHGAVLTGYLGLLLMSGAYISVGILASSLTNNQIVAFLVTLFIGIFFHLLFGLLASGFPGVIGRVLSFMSMQTHYESVSRGVLDTRDIFYFLSFMVTGLVVSEVILAKRNIAEN
jgi:ABC-2 type transport system permease protein